MSAKPSAGMTANINHRLLVAGLLILPTMLYKGHENNFNKSINIHDQDIHSNYQTDLRQVSNFILTKTIIHCSKSGIKLLTKFFYYPNRIIVLGYHELNPNNRCHDQKIEKLSNKQKQLTQH